MNSSLLLLVLILTAIIASTSGVIQQIEIYSELDQGGSYVVFREKIPDLKNWKYFLDNAKSYCVTGYWVFYPYTNYYASEEGVSPTSFAGNGGDPNGYEQRKCGNGGNFYRYSSARFLGPADTRSTAFSLYEGDNHPYVSRELVIEDRYATNFPTSRFTRLLSHGGSNWTLFSGDNFQGTSWCLRTNGYIVQVATINSTVPVRSVIRDCDWETQAKL